MPRNKHPEETINRILDVSFKLFMEKGYEKTSIQDIIDGLGGLTKGAIYHHFRSKEDIMLAVMDRIYGDHDHAWFHTVMDSEMPATEKVRQLFRFSVNSPAQTEMFTTALDMTKNPKMLALQLQGIFQESAPNFLRPILEQGVAEGTIQTDYPAELAEMILLLINLWLSPLVAYAPPQVLANRMNLFRQVMGALGLDVLEQETVDNFMALCEIYEQRR